MDGRYARYAGLGFTFVVLICVFAAGGFFLDRAVGTTPLFVMAGLFAGFAASMSYLFVSLRRMGGG